MGMERTFIGDGDLVARLYESKERTGAPYASHNASLSVYDTEGSVTLASFYVDVGTRVLTDEQELKTGIDTIDISMAQVAQIRAKLIAFEMSAYESKRILIEGLEKLKKAGHTTLSPSLEPDEKEED